MFAFLLQRTSIYRNRDTYKHLHIYVSSIHYYVGAVLEQQKHHHIYTISKDFSENLNSSLSKLNNERRFRNDCARARCFCIGSTTIWSKKYIHCIDNGKDFFLFRLNPIHMCRRISEMHLICIKSNNQLWPNISPSYTELFCFYICFEYILGCG